MRFERTWGPSHAGRGVALRTTATVEGRTYHAETIIFDARDPYYGVPAEYIEREHQRRIMRLIEDDIFGPAR